jgi:hypothetical protein
VGCSWPTLTAKSSYIAEDIAVMTACEWYDEWSVLSLLRRPVTSYFRRRRLTPLIASKANARVAKPSATCSRRSTCRLMAIRASRRSKANATCVQMAIYTFSKSIAFRAVVCQSLLVMLPGKRAQQVDRAPDYCLEPLLWIFGPLISDKLSHKVWIRPHSRGCRTTTRRQPRSSPPVPALFELDIHTVRVI